MASKIGQDVPERAPTCLLINPGRQSGGTRDQLFSDSAVRAFGRAGWNVVWLVDETDSVLPPPYADVHRILPIDAYDIPDPDEFEPQARADHSATSAPVNGGSSPAFQEKITWSVIRLEDWARSTWKKSSAVSHRLAALSLWAIIRIWYRVRYAMSYAKWLTTDLMGRLYSEVYGRLPHLKRVLPRAVVHTLRSARARWIRRSSIVNKTPSHTTPCATPIWQQADVCRLIKECGDNDVVIIPAGTIAQIESVFSLMAHLQLDKPLSTTLHIRLASCDLELMSGDVDDATTLGKRFRSGSPFRNIVMHCDGLELSASAQRQLGMDVYSLPISSGPQDCDLLHRLSPVASRSHDAAGCDVSPSVATEAFGPVVLLVSALWGRGGSGTIFDAQTKYLIDRGCIVVRVLIEHYPPHDEARVQQIGKFLSENFQNTRPHMCFVAYRNDDPDHLSGLQNLPEFRCGSPIRRLELLFAHAIVENEAQLSWLSAKAAFAIVNHLPHVEFTSRLTSAPLILDTHDVCAELLNTHGIPSFVPPGPDGMDLRLAEEKAVWRRVAACVAISPDDRAAIEKDAKLTVLARPYTAQHSVKLRSWLEVLEVNDLFERFSVTSQFDLMLWGSWHEANVEGVRWFLDLVDRDERLQELRILIVGRVLGGLPPALRNRKHLYFTGHVDRIEDFAGRSRILVIPEQRGTGTSMKALAALALGCCFASTRVGFRGITMGDTGYRPSTDGKELADDIAILCASPAAREKRALVARRLYDLNFSEAAFRAAWDHIVSSVVPDLPLGKSLSRKSRAEGAEGSTTSQVPEDAERSNYVNPVTVAGDRETPEPCRSPNWDGKALGAWSPTAMIVSDYTCFGDASAPEISAVLPTRNRSQLLPRILAGIRRQRLNSRQFEVVVVDDGSTDETRAVLETLGPGLSLRVVRQEASGIAVAKNAGVAAARSPVLLFMDDDNALDPGLFEAHVEAHRRHPDQSVAVLGHLRLDPEIAALPLMRHVTEVGCQLFGYGGLRSGQEIDFTGFWGGLVSCKRDFLLDHGVFDPDFTFGCEDIELAWRLQPQGLRVIYEPAAQSVMIRAMSFDDFCRRAMQQGRSQWKFHRKHDDPEIRSYCEIDLALKSWARKGKRYRDVIDQARSLDKIATALVRRGSSPDHLLQARLDKAYREAIFFCRVAGIIEASDGMLAFSS